MKHIALAVFALLFAIASLGCTPAKKVARAYGEDRFGVVRELAFTFNAEVGDRRITRAWTWQPGDTTAEDRITLSLEGKPPLTYVRGQVNDQSPEEVIEADRWFVNDSYWLLFPCQLVWSDVAVTEPVPADRPIGEGPQLMKMVAAYGTEGGYTPGDVYELYVNDDWMIEQWVFRRGDSARPATWEDNVQLGPLVIATEHHGPDGFHLWFSDLSARLWGHDGRFFPKAVK